MRIFVHSRGHRVPVTVKRSDFVARFKATFRRVASEPDGPIVLQYAGRTLDDDV